MNIAAYCRVSTDKDEQLDSLAHQKEFFTAYAARNGHTLVRLYADEGVTGTSLKKRDAFRRLMADAGTGLFQMVVVKDISRFARNTVDALQSIRALKAMGINTLFLTANMDAMGDSEFILTLFSAMAQEESLNLSKRVKWGKRINAEKGRVPQRIYGYDRLDLFTLAINPEEARVVRKIYALYVQGLGCRLISTQLNQAGDRTKFGCQWDARGVRRILTNPLYCGVLVNHKYEIADFLTGKQVALPEPERFYHQRPDWAIITPKLYQQTQEILATRRANPAPAEPFRQARYSGKYLFSTLIRCAHCGRSFARKTYTYVNTRVYWRCVTNGQYTAQRCDNAVTLDEPALLAQLRRYIAALLPDTERFLADVLAEWRRQLPAPAEPSREWERRRQRLTARRQRYQQMFANGLITLEELREKLTPLTAELSAVEAALAAPPAPAADPTEAASTEIRRFLALETVTNGDMRRILDHITVSRDGDVRIYLKNLTEEG